MRQIIVCTILLLMGNVVLAQRTITGVVSDGNGMPLPGVTVLVQNTSIGAVTDFDGFYEVAVNSDTDTLVFSFVGFKTKSVAVGDQNQINISLEESAEALDEVVIVGYGSQKKSDVTGAVASFDAEKLEERPQINIQQALQGSLPGLNISVNTNTASGGSNNINIRGRRSITGDSSPLIVLDGIVFGGSLTEINMNDIQSIEVLKDASSSAIYGARGANGVILITTKKGKLGKPKLNVNTYYAVDSPYELPALMDAETFYARKVIRFGEEALTDTERQVFESGEAVDWVDLILREGSRTEHNLSVSGGTENLKYFISGNFQDVKGVAINDNFSKVNFRTNMEVDLTDWLKLGTNTLVGFADRSGIAGDFTEAFFMNPLTIAYNEDGSLTKFPWPDDTGFSNPLENTLYANSDKVNSLITNNYVLVQFPFLEGLSYRLNTGYTIRNNKQQTYRGRDTRQGDEVGGFARQETLDLEDWLVENILNYNKSFGDHNFFLTALYSAQEITNERLRLDGSGFPNDLRTYYQLNDAEVLEATPGYSQRNYISQMLRLNYNYKSKYSLTLTGRRDGFSVFGEDKKYGFFPSAAVAWNLDREPFLENSNLLNQLKLRLSYGENGNEAVDPYRTLPVLAKTDYIDADGNNLVGYRPSRLGNNSLGWESTTSVNIGLDFGLFRSRINGSLDVYTSTTEDLLLTKSIPAINGTTSILQNIGKTKGSGVELILNTRNIVSDDFSWETQFVFTKSSNEIVHVGLTDDEGNFIDDVGSRWFIGEPVDVNFGYIFNGVWQLDEVEGVNLPDFAVNQAGDVKYADLNGDGMITEEDRGIIGNLQPDFTLGFTNNFRYKNFSLDIFLYWVEGVTKRNPIITTNDFLLRRKVYNVNYWSETNPTNDFPENADRSTNPLGAGFYEDASFLRLKDVTLSYRFPESLMDNLSLDRFELYVNVKNLFTLTDWRGIDPEADDQTNRPFSRTYLFGVRFGF